MKILVAAMIILLAFTTPMAADPTAKTRHEQMIYPVVLVQSGLGSSSGSGTVIFSGEHEGEIHTYILTNHHVVENSIEITQVWCSGPPKCEEPEKIDIETRDTVKAVWFEYNRLSRNIGTRGQRADIVAYSTSYDLALLRTRNTETAIEHVARFIPEKAPIYLGDEIACVGAGLGNPPFMTNGAVGFLDAEVKGEESKYSLLTCNLIFGNSGGAAYRWSKKRRQFELIGVPAKISASWASGPITHMAWAISIETARKFLREHKLGWILGDPVQTEEK
jgi:S1-C subfamily serine protease